MPRRAKELTVKQVEALFKRPPGAHAVGGVPGLYLQISSKTAASWIYRYSPPGAGKRTRDMGLGSFFDVTLEEARDAARDQRKVLRDKQNPRDPLNERKAATSKQVIERRKAVTFKQATLDHLKQNQQAWSNAKHRAQWLRTLETYVFPHCGDVLVGEIDTPMVVSVLGQPMKVKEAGKSVEKPFWMARPETADRVRQRIETVLRAARQMKLITGDWENAAAKEVIVGAMPALKRQSKAVRVRNHPALPYPDVGAFMADLRAADGQGARALEFAVLTAARSGEVRGAKWAEVDLVEKVWTVPAERMKAKRSHRVPLSDAAITLLQKQTRIAGVDLVFPASSGRPLSDMTLAAVVRRLNDAAAKADPDAKKPRWADINNVPVVPHGFRSTFRDWAGERTNFPREVAEMALAHTLKDKTEKSYARGDLFDKRVKMMSAWAGYLAKVEQKAPAKVVAIGS